MRPPNQTGFAVVSFLIGIATVIAVATIIWFNSEAVNRFSHVNTLWLDFTEKETRIAEVIFRLKGSLGYGGMIHNFKNFVLRGSDKYKERLERDLEQVKLDLQSLEPLLQGKNERYAIKDIEMVINEYAEKIGIISALHSQYALPGQIDTVVEVDDTPAIKAMELISSRSIRRSQNNRSETTNALETAFGFLTLGNIVVIPIALLAIALILIIQMVIGINTEINKARGWVNTLLDTSPDPTLCVSVKGVVTRANLSAASFFGYDIKDLVGMEVESLIPQKFRESLQIHRDGFFNHPKRRAMGANMKLFARKSNGEEPQVEISLSHAYAGTEKTAIITLRDITERELDRAELASAKEKTEKALDQLQQAQDSLLESEKLAALGGLVAGVAHEINTPIGVTLSSATHLRAETLKVANDYRNEELTGDELEEHFAMSDEATRLMEINIRRAADLIQSFKQIAVDQSGRERRVFDLKEYLEEVELSVKPALKKEDVEISLECGGGIEVDSYPGAISQCFTNLIMNSLMHAFDNTKERRIGITASLDEASDMVSIRLGDNGRGIPLKEHSSIFEPFYTTKRGQGGSGLGLHIVYNLVHGALNGQIDFESEEGAGTAFLISFPRVNSK